MVYHLTASAHHHLTVAASLRKSCWEDCFSSGRAFDQLPTDPSNARFTASARSGLSPRRSLSLSFVSATLRPRLSGFHVGVLSSRTSFFLISSGRNDRSRSFVRARSRKVNQSSDRLFG